MTMSMTTRVRRCESVHGLPNPSVGGAKSCIFDVSGNELHAGGPKYAKSNWAVKRS